MAAEADAALHAFACVMLALYLAPGGCFLLWRLARSPRALLTSRGLATHAALLAVAAALFAHFLARLQGSGAAMGVFDPYEILGVPDSASAKEIRRAFRSLGRLLHPDKNLGAGAREAASRFARVSKAYEALTDPVAMENYRKYGHPDGRQAISMQLAFSSALGGDSGHVLVAIYFLVVIGGVALVVYKLHKQSATRDRTQVSRRTMAGFQDALRDKMSLHDVVEVLLASDEMTGANSTNTRDQELRELAAQRAKAHDKVIKKMEAAKALPGDALTRIKKHPDPVARENMISLYSFLRRGKLQGVPKPVWVDQRFPRVLLEMPFLVDIFAKLVAEQSVKRAYPALPLLRTLSLLPALSQGHLVADENALREQSARIATAAAVSGEDATAPGLEVSSTSLAVLDEPNVQPGDWLTLQFNLRRRHVKPGAVAALASTIYDEVDKASPFRKDHLWVVVMDKGGGRLYAAWKIVDLSAEVAQTKGFLGPESPGKYEIEVRVVSIAYLGVEASVVIPLEVMAK